MKVSGAMAMADNLEAFGMTEGKIGSESMVDRIAAVLRSRVDVSCPDDRCMCDQGDVRWSCILGISPIQLARAAIEAMRSPPKELQEAARWHFADTDINDWWNCMIDAALRETK